MRRRRVPERYSLTYGNSIFTHEQSSTESQAMAFHIMELMGCSLPDTAGARSVLAGCSTR